LQAGLIALEKSWDDVAASRKGADWKISLARYLGLPEKLRMLDVNWAKSKNRLVRCKGFG
jgi:hypothetical protein